ncbi:MAG: hypothetical protein ACFB10_10770 [Salibacteraceae bacterium]
MKWWFLVLTGLIIGAGCAVTKEDKRIRKGTGVFRDSEVLLGAHWEGAIGSESFTLRNNQFFIWNKNVLWSYQYYVGSWTQQGDTFYLQFVDDHQPEEFLNYMVVDSTAQLLHFQRKDTLKPYSLEIVYDTLLN